MLRLTIIKETWFKKATTQSKDLSDSHKVKVSAGKTFNFRRANRTDDNHYFVKLESSLGFGDEGFFFHEHVSVEEIRGVWLTLDDSDVLLTEDNIKAALQKLKDCGFNTIYPVVWHSGHTLYPSAVAKAFIGNSVMPGDVFKGVTGRNTPQNPFEKDSRGKDRNMLAELVQASKDQGLRIIPWFEFGLMMPPGSKIATAHSDLITHTKSGNPIRIKTADGKPDPFIWMNPWHPKVRQFMRELVTDVAAHYDVDGIQFDDHLAFPVELGFDSATEKAFEQDNPGKSARTEHSKNSSVWVNWACTKVFELLKEVFTAVHTVRPNCLISISPNPQSFSKRDYMADWQRWVQDGYVEELVLQVYKDQKALSGFKNELDKTEVTKTRQHIPVAIGIKTGLRTQPPIGLDFIKSEIQEVRNRHLAGVSFFFYETVFNNFAASPPYAKSPRTLSAVKDLFKL